MNQIEKLFSLKGKCAVIFGGAGKVGLPITEAMIVSGANTVVVSRNKSKLTTTKKYFNNLGLDCDVLVADQSDEKQVKEVLKIINLKYKTPDILINSGGIRPMKKNFDDTVKNWDKSMIVNSRGIFVTCRLFAKAMKKNKVRGSIINVSSIYGLVAPDMKIYEGSNFETEPDYPFIKGGIISFSKYLASYLSDYDIRVNCIAPGGVFNNQKNPFLTKYVKKTLLKRMARPDDLKGVAVFLSSEASSYITGCVIPVDGGFTTI